MIRSVALLAAENPQTLAEKAMYALENSLLGVIITFSVLAVLFIIVKLAGNILSRNKNEAKAESKTAPTVPSAPPTPTPAATAPKTGDDGEIIAAITAAISMMLEAEGKDPRGFRVVSFRRSSSRK